MAGPKHIYNGKRFTQGAPVPSIRFTSYHVTCLWEHIVAHGLTPENVSTAFGELEHKFGTDAWDDWERRKMAGKIDEALKRRCADLRRAGVVPRIWAVSQGDDDDNGQGGGGGGGGGSGGDVVLLRYPDWAVAWVRSGHDWDKTKDLPRVAGEVYDPSVPAELVKMEEALGMGRPRQEEEGRQGVASGASVFAQAQAPGLDPVPAPAPTPAAASAPARAQQTIPVITADPPPYPPDPSPTSQEPPAHPGVYQGHATNPWPHQHQPIGIVAHPQPAASNTKPSESLVYSDLMSLDLDYSAPANSSSTTTAGSFSSVVDTMEGLTTKSGRSRSRSQDESRGAPHVMVSPATTMSTSGGGDDNGGAGGRGPVGMYYRMAGRCDDKSPTGPRAGGDVRAEVDEGPVLFERGSDHKTRFDSQRGSSRHHNHIHLGAFNNRNGQFLAVDAPTAREVTYQPPTVQDPDPYPDRRHREQDKDGNSKSTRRGRSRTRIRTGSRDRDGALDWNRSSAHEASRGIPTGKGRSSGATAHGYSRASPDLTLAWRDIFADYSSISAGYEDEDDGAVDDEV